MNTIILPGDIADHIPGHEEMDIVELATILYEKYRRVLTEDGKGNIVTMPISEVEHESI